MVDISVDSIFLEFLTVNGNDALIKASSHSHAYCLCGTTPWECKSHAPASEMLRPTVGRRVTVHPSRTACP